MKFYNPFKAHIVEFTNGKYAVRRWRLAWEYKERLIFGDDDFYWWYSMENVKNWCMVDTLEQAAVLRDKVHVKSSPPTTKVLKVYG